MEEAGVYKITLYENNSVNITYDGSGAITSISTSGDTIDLTNCVNQPRLEVGMNSANNNTLLFDYVISAELHDFSAASYTILEQIYESTYGWIPEIEYYNGTKILINDPFFGESNDLDANVSMSYSLEIKPRKESTKIYKFFA